ncbi:MAG TPA: hypothetical protein VEJ23_05615 [Solirubrobacteraceae bacterium]|nr:hypothetical protein [Solirubrobacteraceae bacterium]
MIGAFTGGFTRVLCCVLLFGLGAEALGGGAVGLVASAIVALGVNYLWRKQQQERLLREHRERIEADEDLRLAVRERRLRP